MDYEKLLAELIEEMDEGIHVVNRDGISIMYSEKMASIEQVRREDILGKNFRDTFSFIPEEESTMIKALRGIATSSHQQTFKNAYGKVITTVNTTVPLWKDGEILGAMEMARDITYIKQLSDQLLALQEEMIGPPKLSQPKIRHYNFYDLIGRDRRFTQAVNMAKKAAKSEAPVFIYGETGTGKELFAQSIHYDGLRHRKPFLAQNCAAIPESLLEGILFGTVKGGFTGAVDRAGLFEQANGGTLLLDEVSAMPYELQSKLLRVLQENYIRRIGGTQDIPVDVRIIATVNERPGVLIEKNALRPDLYYRLAVLNVEIPALRERKADIAPLAERFLDKYGKEGRKVLYRLTMPAIEKLKGYDYPGNVRELENIIQSAVAMTDGEEISPENILLPQSQGINKEKELVAGNAASGNQLAEGKRPSLAEAAMAPTVLGNVDISTMEGMTLPERLAAVEQAIIRQTMQKEEGNVSRAAKKLGIKRQGLQYKLRHMGKDR